MSTRVERDQSRYEQMTAVAAAFRAGRRNGVYLLPRGSRECTRRPDPLAVLEHQPQAVDVGDARSSPAVDELVAGSRGTPRLLGRDQPLADLDRPSAGAPPDLEAEHRLLRGGAPAQPHASLVRHRGDALAHDGGRQSSMDTDRLLLAGRAA